MIDVTKNRWILSTVTAFLCCAALFLSSLLVGWHHGADSMQAEAPSRYLLRVENGQLAVYAGGAGQPELCGEVTLSALPEEEQQHLLQGVWAESRQELEGLLQDYSS